MTFILLLLTACGDKDTALDPTHDTDIQPIWNANCTGCHPSNAGLSLTSGFAALVNVASSQSSKDRVEPCLIADSYLWHKLNGTQADVGGSDDAMPLSGSMESDEMDLIEAWINEGCAP